MVVYRVSPAPTQCWPSGCIRRKDQEQEGQEQEQEVAWPAGHLDVMSPAGWSVLPSALVISGDLATGSQACPEQTSPEGGADRRYQMPRVLTPVSSSPREAGHQGGAGGPRRAQAQRRISQDALGPPQRAATDLDV